MRKLGIDTTCAAIPAAFSSSAAFRQIALPSRAAIKITSGEVTSGVIEYAPFGTPVIAG